MKMALSITLYTAQKLAAQYAWHKPRATGNKREKTCPSWPFKILRISKDNNFAKNSLKNHNLLIRSKLAKNFQSRKTSGQETRTKI